MGRFRRSVSCAFALVALVAVPSLSGCASGSDTGAADPTARMIESTKTVGGEGVATIYLAGGCFWGLEKYMASVNGVLEAEAGYANGVIDSPTYDEVSTGRTGFAETVRVEYDPDVAPLPFLLDLFYDAIDPTTLNRQGNDVGTQYRSGIYYSDPADLPTIERSLAQLQERYETPIAVEAGPLSAYTPAEEYHQDYLDKNPGGYCHIGRDLFEKAAQAVPDPSQFPSQSDVEP